MDGAVEVVEVVGVVGVVGVGEEKEKDAIIPEPKNPMWKSFVCVKDPVLGSCWGVPNVNCGSTVLVWVWELKKVWWVKTMILCVVGVRTWVNPRCFKKSWIQRQRN